MNREHHILIITKNTNGIVARIMSLFNRRGYFVKKMSAGVTNKENLCCNLFKQKLILPIRFAGAT